MVESRTLHFCNITQLSESRCTTLSPRTKSNLLYNANVHGVRRRKTVLRGGVRPRPFCQWTCHHVSSINEVVARDLTVLLGIFVSFKRYHSYGVIISRLPLPTPFKSFQTRSRSLIRLLNIEWSLMQRQFAGALGFSVSWLQLQKAQTETGILPMLLCSIREFCGFESPPLFCGGTTIHSLNIVADLSAKLYGYQGGLLAINHEHERRYEVRFNSCYRSSKMSLHWNLSRIACHSLLSGDKNVYCYGLLHCSVISKRNSSCVQTVLRTAKELIYHRIRVMSVQVAISELYKWNTCVNSEV